LTRRIRHPAWSLARLAAGYGNNEILCPPELIETKQACLNGIAIVKAEAAYAQVVDSTADTKGRATV